MCIERFVCECPFRSTIDYQGKQYVIDKVQTDYDLVRVTEKNSGHSILISMDEVVVSHYISAIDYLHMKREGKQIPSCHVPISLIEND